MYVKQNYIIIFFSVQYLEHNKDVHARFLHSQNNLTYRQRYLRDRADLAEILPHNENSTISRLGVQLVGLHVGSCMAVNL